MAKTMTVTYDCKFADHTMGTKLDGDEYQHILALQ